MFGMFAAFHIMSIPAISMFPIAYMTHFCSHRPRRRRAQRIIHLYLALVDAVNQLQNGCTYLLPTSSVWESSCSTASQHLESFICLLFKF